MRRWQGQEATRAELDGVQQELDEACNERDEALAKLQNARRQLEHTSPRLTPRLELHTAKMPALMEMLKSARQDRQRLGESIAGYRKMADKGLWVLKRLVERPPSPRAADRAEKEIPQTD